MEEVPAHVHPGPIVPDVLTRQDEYRYKVKKEPLEAWILREFTGSESDDDLILHARGFILFFEFVWLSYHDCGLVPSDLWQAEVPLKCFEIVEYHHHGREVDDMATEVIQGPPSSSTQIASFAKKVQTIIRGCMLSHLLPREPVSDLGARGVKRGARRLLGCRARGGCTPVPPHQGWMRTCRLRTWRRESPNLDFPTFNLGLTPPAQSHPGGLGISYAPPPSGILGSSIQAPPPPGLGFSSFQAPLPLSIEPPPGTVGSSTLHMPISYASSSDSDERTDDVTPKQQLGFDHHDGKKTTRFTPSD
ncbi:hypothetical protein M9H77_25445 [Catharanthus roseus]|uniref:Uncharacterized protein n=1 Tax=Catharanthus roseus TaxID=4058 RepID=A0ACC0A6X1_CATRO|nr:hypothetical protein M9H77_25445 [Catharanthus roseus]